MFDIAFNFGMIFHVSNVGGFFVGPCL